MKKISALLFGLSFLASFSLSAQDIHFNQIYLAPTWINPSYSGSYQGSFKVFMQYRSQWNNTLEQGIQDFIVGGDVVFDVAKLNVKNPDRASGSLLFVSDQYGSFDFSTNAIMLSGAFHKSLSRASAQYLSAGVQMGIKQRGFIYSDILFEDQFNGVNEFNLPSSENLPENTFSYFDLNLGLNYSGSFDRFKNVQIGIAGQHVLTPNVSFYENINDPTQVIETQNNLLRRFNISGSFDYEMNDFVRVIPRALYSSQAEYALLQFGTNFRFDVGEQAGRAFQVGAGTRLVDGVDDFQLTEIILFSGIEFQGLNIGISYDLNTSSFNASGQRPSTFEIGISFVGNYTDEDDTCPKF